MLSFVCESDVMFLHNALIDKVFFFCMIFKKNINSRESRYTFHGSLYFSQRFRFRVYIMFDNLFFYTNRPVFSIRVPLTVTVYRVNVARARLSGTVVFGGQENRTSPTCNI